MHSKNEQQESFKCRGETEMKIGKILVAAIALFAIYKFADPGGAPSKQGGSPVLATATTAPSRMLSTMPDLETRFVAAVEHGRSVYKSGANDMARGAARPL